MYILHNLDALVSSPLGSLRRRIHRKRTYFGWTRSAQDAIPRFMPVVSVLATLASSSGSLDCGAPLLLPTANASTDSEPEATLDDRYRLLIGAKDGRAAG